MDPLPLHDFHSRSNGQFAELTGKEAVLHYGDSRSEHAAIRTSAGLIDLSFRGRLCLLGEDRHRFLHGQVTNEVNGLKVGQGCYAALITAKGRMISDLNICRLENELLLDFEPGLTEKVKQRLEQYIIADDVQVLDVSAQYGLLSVQGPKSAAVVRRAGFKVEPPEIPFHSAMAQDSQFGEICLVNQPRVGSSGFDVFVPSAALIEIAQQLQDGLTAEGGQLCGWEALETARVEQGLPRFGRDMDETNLPPEAGLEARAISYSKGCYIGQEVIARIRTYGQVAKNLRGLRLADDLPSLPAKGDKLFKEGKEIGFITSAVTSPGLRANIALGYVRREVNATGTELTLRTPSGESVARIVDLPFAS